MSQKKVQTQKTLGQKDEVMIWNKKHYFQERKRTLSIR